MELLLSILIGIGLSATAGFRLFIPLLVLSGFSLLGWIELSPRPEHVSRPRLLEVLNTGLSHD